MESVLHVSVSTLSTDTGWAVSVDNAVHSAIKFTPSLGRI